MAISTAHRFRNEALLSARISKGLTQRQLAGECERIGYRIDHSNISKYERGKFVPSSKTLSKLAEALGVNVSDLFEVVPANGAKPAA